MQLRTLITAAIAVLMIGILPASGGNLKTDTDNCIRGKILDSNGRAIAGASVAVYADTVFQYGAASDRNGNFDLPIQSDINGSLMVRVQSIAHKLTTITLSDIDSRDDLKIFLQQKAFTVNTVTVKPRRSGVSDRVKIGRKEIREKAGSSIIASDPVNAIQQPQVVRAGSNSSSKLRVAGTNPIYYLNGMKIGQDPNHYGVFSIIPAAIVDKLDMYSSGTPSRYGPPSIVSMQTPWPDDDRESVDLSFSVIDASATTLISRERYFVLGAVRKSVLDRLAQSIDYKSEQMTLPPTNYRDAFFSGGLKISDNVRLGFNQLFTRDFLSFRLDPSSINPDGVATYQHAREEHFGTLLEINRGNLMVCFRGGYMSRFEQYYARAGGSESPTGLYVDLKARRQTGTAGIDAHILMGNTEFSAGQEIVISDREHVSLKHKNWNFLPADASSDNPYIYQDELNGAFNSMAIYRDGREGSGYLSVSRDFGAWKMMAGLRGEYFDGLATNFATSWRTEISGTIGSNQRCRAGIGTYYEHPLSRVLESYQVIIRSYAYQLTPVKTTLAHISYSYGPITVSGYRKSISSVPVVCPNLGESEDQDVDNQSFLEAMPDGRINFTGGDVAFDLNVDIMFRFSLSGYYAFAHADKVTGSTEVPYELNAKHTFYAQGKVRVSRKVSISPTFMVRSGYAYTPALDEKDYSDLNPESEEYYETYLKGENSEQFPFSMQINFQTTYSTGKTELFFGINNLTNHDNAIINNSAGYVYDVGIMPVLGLRYAF